MAGSEDYTGAWDGMGTRLAVPRDPRDVKRIEELEAALLTIARREAPGSDNYDWAEVELARAALTRLGVEWRRARVERNR